MRSLVVGVTVPLLLLLAGAAVPGVAPAAVAAPTEAPTVSPLPVGADVDYQLGGAAPVPASVGTVVRDRAATPVPGRYNVCYVNGFQTQASERRSWRAHPRLVLRRHGRPVTDAAWGEWLLDLRTPARRHALARIVGRWTRGCATRGFDAVELDNLDSWTRSRGLLTQAQALAYARLLVRDAHAAGLAVGQKNAPELDGRRLGYDFAVAEECGRYHECAAYTAHYGRRVLAIEYRAADFATTCRDVGAALPVVLRDRDLTPGGIRRWC